MRERVLEWPVSGPVDPERAFAALWADAPAAFWLDTGGAGGGTSYLGAAAWTVDGDELRDAGQDVFAWLRAQRGRWDVDPGEGIGFRLGLVGWLGYELHAGTLGVPAPYLRRYPDAMLMRVDRALAVDQATGEGRLLAQGAAWTGELADWRDATLAALAALPFTPADAQPAAPLDRVQKRQERPPGSAFVSEMGAVSAQAGPAPARWRYTDETYAEMIAACQASIAEGDAYVLCLTNEAEVDGGFDAWEVYRRLRRSSPSHHGALLRADGIALLSASPEQFLSVGPGGRVATKPIKGTRPRGATPAEDAALREELRADEKERAENVMIVDLMRNDLSRVCTVGTVEVTALLQVETYPHVHQLVSTVEGALAPGRDAIDAIRSCFPAGSMTGAPKHSAVTILSRLEQRSRGIYSGAFGYLGLDGAVDLAMTIRSIVVDQDGATIGAGGGITALSRADEEVAEMHLKARALLDALGPG